jgi:Ni,Fe-hydrogenase III large subunit
VTPAAALRLRNGQAAPLADLEALEVEAWRQAVLAEVGRKGRLASLFGLLARRDAPLELVAVVAHDRDGSLVVLRAALPDGRYQALTPACPQAHLFERELAEQLGVVPEGHPWLKPVRFHRPWREAAGGGAPVPPPGTGEFFHVAGEEVHEVAVGPVHAGVIEPGHFRFQCHGERVLHLEIALGYQHRGVEQALLGGPHKLTVHQVATAAGDTSVGHTLAYCQTLEGLSGCTPPPRAQALRGIGLELERLANHVGDLGALSGDVAYLPAAAFCGRIRGDFLNLTAALCGSRLGRGLLRPGGVGFDAEPALSEALAARLEAAERDAREAIELLWRTPTVVARFESTGVVRRQDCEDFGFVGPTARACAVARDARHDHPFGVFERSPVPVSTAHHGDVNARAEVRRLEVRRSVDFVREQLARLPDGPVRAPVGALAADHLAVSLVEGFRGEICHVAVTDGGGRFARYKITDPSFHNWQALALAMRDGQISDFPLCNKSFNLSYCGHDL